jgi:hypothetical protein
MIPRALSEWSLQSIRDLLAMGMFEPDTFDWKETLPVSKDEEGKRRLRKTCAAFANSFGGFIIFGIKDRRDLSVDERLIGMNAAFELPREFGNYPAGCSPSVEWTPLQPAIRLANGNMLHVVSIPRSWRAPHAVGNAERGWEFPKRTNKGNEGMSLEEIRNAFTRLAETRRSLVALSRNLELNRNAWSQKLADLNEGKSVYLGESLTRALEDFMSAPVFENEIPFNDVAAVWQWAKRSDRLVEIFTAPINVVPAKDAARQGLLNIFNRAVPTCDKLIATITRILRRLEDTPQPDIA